MKQSFERAFLLPFAVVFLSVAVAAQSGRIQPTPTPDDETVRITTEEIKLNVLAFDARGGFFSGVTADDLVITEDNILHQPSSVRRIPANVLIVMDTGGEYRSVKSLDWTRKVASAVVEGLRPDDPVAILEYHDTALIVDEWTTDKAQTLAAIRSRTNFGRRSAYVDALKLATDLLLRSPIENRHLVLITDGTDGAGAPSAKFDAYQRLLATDISVHVLSYTAMEADDIEPRTKNISNTPPPKAMPD
jgi:Mg-chelatase subunit ChlD